MKYFQRNLAACVGFGCRLHAFGSKSSHFWHSLMGSNLSPIEILLKLTPISKLDEKIWGYWESK